MTFHAQLDHDDEQLDVICSCQIDRDATDRVEIVLESCWREGDASRTLIETTEADEALLRAMAAERAMP